MTPAAKVLPNTKVVVIGDACNSSRADMAAGPNSEGQDEIKARGNVAILNGGVPTLTH